MNIFNDTEQISLGNFKIPQKKVLNSKFVGHSPFFHVNNELWHQNILQPGGHGRKHFQIYPPKLAKQGVTCR